MKREKKSGKKKKEEEGMFRGIAWEEGGAPPFMNVRWGGGQRFLSPPRKKPISSRVVGRVKRQDDGVDRVFSRCRRYSMPLPPHWYVTERRKGKEEGGHDQRFFRTEKERRRPLVRQVSLAGVAYRFPSVPV